MSQIEVLCRDTVNFKFGQGTVSLADADVEDFKLTVLSELELQLSGLPASAKTCHIYSADGRELMQEKLVSKLQIITRPTVLPKGYYVLSIVTGSGESISRAFFW